MTGNESKSGPTIGEGGGALGGCSVTRSARRRARYARLRSRWSSRPCSVRWWRARASRRPASRAAWAQSDEQNRFPRSQREQRKKTCPHSRRAHATNRSDSTSGADRRELDHLHAGMRLLLARPRPVGGLGVSPLGPHPFRRSALGRDLSRPSRSRSRFRRFQATDDTADQSHR